MSKKPLCGYCYNECTDDCCDKRRIDVLERQLAEARELIEECLSRTSDGNFKDCVRKKLKEQG